MHVPKGTRQGGIVNGFCSIKYAAHSHAFENAFLPCFIHMCACDTRSLLPPTFSYSLTEV